MRYDTYDAIVVGTGAAGYHAAIRLAETKRVAIVTEGVNCGTSRNTGSDKQTYYKLGLAGDSPDSVGAMAADLFAGGSVDGDNALCEAALSVRCFLHLGELGVGFPVNRYGEYVGYKTDHDPRARATSVGPLTSKVMTERLQKRAEELHIPVYDGYLATEILKDGDRVCGMVCLEIASGEFTAFRCGDIVLATGGPAGIYADSVYPEGHTGSTGLALLAGAKTQNLTQWQFGLASVAPRWNVSGSYMQVLPRFVSVDEAGREHEFLGEYFRDPYDALSTVFLKGYQWPFDAKKVLSGSSVIDLLVYRERVLKKRRVYLDFTKNPFGLEAIEFDRLSGEAYIYLKKAGVCFGTPIRRLSQMNAPAVALYQSKGLDITKEYLEIALCAQHHNGGIAVDAWWRSSVRGLFAAGECAGTHGLTRPGGSALNAGQVGALRAAQYIGRHGNPLVSEAAFEKKLAAFSAVRNDGAGYDAALQKARRRMSDCAGAVRDRAAMEKALEEVQRELATLPEGGNTASYYKLRDALVTQAAVLTAALDAAARGSCGSALYYDPKGSLREGLEEIFRFSEAGGSLGALVQETHKCGDDFGVRWRPVRPIPDRENFFETVWKGYRENKNID